MKKGKNIQRIRKECTDMLDQQDQNGLRTKLFQKALLPSVSPLLWLGGRPPFLFFALRNEEGLDRPGRQPATVTRRPKRTPFFPPFGGGSTSFFPPPP